MAMRSLAGGLCFLAAILALSCGPALPQSGPLDVGRVRLPGGFRISLFADRAPGARMMVFSPSGWLLVSLTGEGSILALADPNHTGRATRSFPLVQGLNQPHGMAFSGRDLYVAETGRVVRFPDAEGALQAGRFIEKARAEVVVPDIPSGGVHFTRTIVFAPSGDLLISVGSSCNLCEERDQRRAAVLRVPKAGGAAAVYASGLRNAVGLRINPQDGTLWTTDNGRDSLGDNLPPEEINIVSGPGFYGWPYCYGNNVPNPEYSGTARCRNAIPPALTLPAHNAPLGFDFYRGEQFPPEYRGDAFVALHGSWNRSTPDGYKVVRVRVENGRPTRWEDFATGWLSGRQSWGRPVDVVSGPDGALYVSDDRADAIYRITYAP